MENRESTSCGWCPSELLPWIQSQDPKKLFAFGIAMILIAGKLARILTDFFFDFPKFSPLFSGTAVLLGLGILEISQPIKDVFGALGAGLSHFKDFIMMPSGFNYSFSRTAVQDNAGAFTPRVTRSMVNRINNLNNTQPESGE